MFIINSTTSTLWLFHIAMEHGPIEIDDKKYDLPFTVLKNDDFPFTPI